jgi:Leucine-rich repeat (LRR) protein
MINLVKLKKLDISSNHLTNSTKLASFLSKTCNLRVLIASNNQLDNHFTLDIKGSSKLRELTINNNKIESFSIEGVGI